MKRLWNELAEMLVGRKIHSIALQPGGFTHLPTVKQLKDMKEKLLAGVDDLLETAKLIKAAVMPNVPNYSRDTEFVSLSKPDEYAYIDGVIKSSDGPAVDIQKYREYIKEFVVKHSSSKHCTATRDSFMVGALARFNNNYDLLNETAKSVAKDLGLEKGCNNTYAISIAQLVEVVHCHFDAIRIIDELIERGIEQESPNVVVKAGRGVGAIDVPRGLLIHDYEINEEGKVVHANCIIPTGMNLENIDKDMEKIVPEMLAAGQTKEQITLGLEMLVRAYDPCISCSCHMLNVKFINE
jgi:coenzyme F420-reducing hydrogenase alpha subunit